MAVAAVASRVVIGGSFAAEMIVAQRGLGYLIVRSMESGNMGNILIAIIFISGISSLLSYLFNKLEAIICPW